MINILITGVSSGIGYHLVLKFSQNPDNKIIGFSRNKSKLKKLKIDLGESNANVFLEAQDINAISAARFKNILAKHNFNKVDILVNNAGLLINKPFLKLNAKDWQSVFQTNVFSLAHITKLAHPFIKKSKKGHVLNMSSMGGIPVTDKFPGLAAYSASKSAVSVLTEVMAKEFNNDKIACNCIALGAIDTPMLQKAFPGYKAQVGPQEAADFIADFAINAPQVCNGKIIPLALSDT